MKDEFENVEWESCLRAAVIENGMRASDALSDEEASKTDLPYHYDQKMRAMIRNCGSRARLRASIKRRLKTASIALAALCIGFAVLMQSGQIRSSCKNFIMHTFDRYIQFNFSPDKGRQGTYKELRLHYVPEGFTLYQSSSDELGKRLVYKNDAGDEIQLLCYDINVTSQIDNEHYSISDIKINGFPGKYFGSQDAEFSNYILWNTEAEFYMLSSDLDFKEMKEIAENASLADWDPDGRTAMLSMDYIPEGFRLMRSEYDEDTIILEYENDAGNIVAAACYLHGHAVQMDNEGHRISDVKINGIPGKFFESQKEGMRSYILWNTGTECFCLSSDLDFKEMKKIAENASYRNGNH